MNQYQSPINVLYDSIMDAFDTCSEQIASKLKSAAEQGLIRHAIYISPNLEPLITPRADLRKKEIQLHNAHLSYLWTVCYAMVGFQELAHDSALSVEGSQAYHKSPEFALLALVINWGVSLNHMYRIWPGQIPTPDDKSERVVFANELFLYTIRYQMYHEVAHLLYHSSSLPLVIKANEKVKLDPEEARRLNTMELQADDFAFDCMFFAGETEPQRYMKVLGAVIAHLSNFYLLVNTNTSGITHPDLSTRLKRVLSKGKINEQPFVTYIHLTLTIGLQVFLSLHKVDYLTEMKGSLPYETPEELEEDLFAIIDRLKEA